MTNLTCFYRISDNSQKTTDADGNIQIKQKPDYITKRNCFDNFVRAFKEHTIIVIADNCCNDTLSYITKILYEKEINFTVIPTNFGNGAASFRKCVTKALNMEGEKKLLGWQSKNGGDLTRINISHVEKLGKFEGWKELRSVMQLAAIKKI